MIKKYIISCIDKLIFNFLDRNVHIMPLRFTKMVAMFYGDARIRRKYWCKLGVHIGSNTYMNFGFNVLVSDLKHYSHLSIGKNVSIASNFTVIVDSIPNNSREIINHQYIINKLKVDGKIIICDEVWIGANVTVLPNVIIGRGAIIGAGSVVLTDVEPYSIYAGVPAKKIRTYNACQ